MRFAFFAGKGGVGKTTLAAAAAAALAERGQEVLAISTDPAHSLGDALGVRLGARPRKVAARLFAAEMDADAALRRWSGAREKAFRILASRGTYLDDEDVDQLVTQSLPGVDELIGLVELSRLARSVGPQQVVVDTAPTGHTLRLLAMPDTLSRLARVLDDLQGKHRWMSRSLRGRYVPDASDEVIEGIESEAADLRGMIHAAAFHWVLLPEELALREAQDGAAALSRMGARVEELVANRLTPVPPGACALDQARRAEEARVLGLVRNAFPGVPLRLVPAQESEPRGLAALRRLERARLHPSAAARRAPRSPLPHGGGWAPPEGVRLLMFGGKGGVGKTTCAAACALGLARSGRRVLLISTDPAHSLGDALDLPLSDQEREIAPRLLARELDADRAFSAERERYRRSVDELFDALRGGSRFDATFDRVVVQDLIDLAPPGIDELFALFAVIDALSGGKFDAVVVDTAPTGHALRLLELPRKALGWVHALLAILLKYRRVIGLGDAARTLTNTARELRELQELLCDPRRALFVPVARAAELPRLETERLLRALKRLGIAAGPVLVNALTPPGCARCRRAAAAEAEQLAALRRRTPAMLAAPAVAPPPRGAEALEQFGRTWAAG